MSAAATQVFEDQAAFRALMDAMARPGEIVPMHAADAPPPLLPASAAVLRCLADYETPVWLDAPFAHTPAVGEWIRFRTGAPLVEDARLAAFALADARHGVPDFMQFSQGTEEYPDRSATLIVQVDALGGDAFALAGPGIRAVRRFGAAPLPADFVQRCADNRELFPRGIDLILVAAREVAALPRSARVMGKT